MSSLWGYPNRPTSPQALRIIFAVRVAPRLRLPLAQAYTLLWPWHDIITSYHKHKPHMMNNMKYVGSALAVLLLAQPAFALEVGTGTGTGVRAELKADYLRAKADLNVQAQAERKATTSSASNLEVNTKLMADRAALKATLQTKLAAIKDEAKQKIVLRVEDGLVNLNARLATKFDITLDRMEALSARIDTEISAAAARGANVAAATAAQAEAKADVLDARARATAQAAKTYALNIGTEATLKAKLKEARAKIHADLKSVQESIVSARESLRAAAKAVTQLQVRGNVSGSASSTVSQ